MAENVLPWGLIIDSTLRTATAKGWLDRIYSLFREKRKILILGASGVGKTLMMKSFKENVLQSIPGHDRTRFTKTTKMLFGSYPFIFHDTPGHRSYGTDRKDWIMRSIQERVTGIINVVSYGYHEGMGSTLDAIGTNNLPSIEYLETRREVEIDLLNEWVSWVSKDFTNWVITVVTKADLWWSNYAQIYQYYENGPYFNALGTFTSSVHHVVLPYSSIIEPFYGISSPCIGETQKQNLQNNFLNHLLTACERTR